MSLSEPIPVNGKSQFQMYIVFVDQNYSINIENSSCISIIDSI